MAAFPENPENSSREVLSEVKALQCFKFTLYYENLYCLFSSNLLSSVLNSLEMCLVTAGGFEGSEMFHTEKYFCVH